MFGFSQSNFDLIRLIAAKHSLAHLVPDEFLYWAKACFAFAPGVPIFFTRFLISGSWERSPSAAEYARRRLDRCEEGSMSGLGWISCNVGAARHGALAVAAVDTSGWVVAVQVVVWRYVADRGPGSGDIARSAFAPWLTVLPIAAAAFGRWVLLSPFGVPGVVVAVAVIGPVAGIASLLAIRLSQPSVHAELAPAFAGAVRKARSLQERLVARFVSRGS